jgi:hypothetical protein
MPRLNRREVGFEIDSDFTSDMLNIKQFQFRNLLGKKFSIAEEYSELELKLFSVNTEERSCVDLRDCGEDEEGYTISWMGCLFPSCSHIDCISDATTADYERTMLLLKKLPSPKDLRVLFSYNKFVSISHGKSDNFFNILRKQLTVSELRDVQVLVETFSVKPTLAVVAVFYRNSDIPNIQGMGYYREVNPMSRNVKLIFKNKFHDDDLMSILNVSWREQLTNDGMRDFVRYLVAKKLKASDMSKILSHFTYRAKEKPFAVIGKTLPKILQLASTGIRFTIDSHSIVALRLFNVGFIIKLHKAELLFDISFKASSMTVANANIIEKFWMKHSIVKSTLMHSINMVNNGTTSFTMDDIRNSMLMDPRLVDLKLDSNFSYIDEVISMEDDDLGDLISSMRDFDDGDFERLSRAIEYDSKFSKVADKKTKDDLFFHLCNGEILTSCQTIGDVGESCAYLSWEDGNKGVFGVFSKTGSLLAQSFFWINGEDLVLDNIESRRVVNEHIINEYVQFINFLFKKFTSIVIGTGYTECGLIDKICDQLNVSVYKSKSDYRDSKILRAEVPYSDTKFGHYILERK